MTPQIKFRGFRTDGKGWAIGSYVHDEEWAKHYIFAKEKVGAYFQLVKHEIHPESLGMFTGLHDKNGNEIYGAIGEKGGDVVETDGSMNFSNYDSDKGAKREIILTDAGFVGVRLGNQFDKEHFSSAHIWSNYQLKNISQSLEIIGNQWEVDNGKV